MSTSNPVFEAVRTILAVREYRDEEVPEDVLRRCVEAAHLSASAMNRQPWHFVLVRRRETLRELGGLVTTGPYIAGAAAAVVVAVEKASRKGSYIRFTSSIMRDPSVKYPTRMRMAHRIMRVR